MREKKDGHHERLYEAWLRNSGRGFRTKLQ
jgi:hypothetical protein